MYKLKTPTNLKKVGSIVLLVIVAGVIGYRLADSKVANDRKSNDSVTVPAPAYKAIKYPDNWSEDQHISGEDDQLHVISRASRKSPRATAFIRTQEGQLANDFDINKTSDEIVHSLSDEIENFLLVEKKITNAGDYNSIQIRYKQLDDQYILVVIPRPNEAFYLTVKSKATDFEKINSDIESIINSLASYIVSRQ